MAECSLGAEDMTTTTSQKFVLAAKVDFRCPGCSQTHKRSEPPVKLVMVDLQMWRLCGQWLYRWKR